MAAEERSYACLAGTGIWRVRVRRHPGNSCCCFDFRVPVRLPASLRHAESCPGLLSHTVAFRHDARSHDCLRDERPDWVLLLAAICLLFDRRPAVDEASMTA